MNNAEMNQAGFSFIEVLTVVVFLSLMMMLSSVQYASYKREAFNAATNSDFRNSMSYLEVYLQDNEQYPNCAHPLCETVLPGLKISPGVHVAYSGVNDTSVLGVACHERGDIRLVYTDTPGIIVSMRTGPCGV